MTRRSISDTLIHEALVLDAGGALPMGVLEAISDGIRRTRQDRPLLGHFGLVDGLVGARPERGSQGRSRTGVLVMVGALLALVAGMLLLGGGRPGPGPLPSAMSQSPGASSLATPAASLVPFTTSGVAHLVPIGGGELWAAGTRDGIDVPAVWHGTMSGGVWETFGPAGGIIRSIDVLPDGRPIVVIDSGAHPHDDGVWMRADDGAWGRIIDPPVSSDDPVSGLFVAGDGSVWVAYSEGEAALLRNYRVDGRRWSKEARVERPAGGALFAETLDGSIWTGGITDNGLGGLAKCTTTGCEAAIAIDAEIVDLTAAPDGAIAVIVAAPTAEVGVYTARIDELVDGSWTTVAADATSYYSQIEYASDGSLWHLNGDGELQRRDATGSWTTQANSGPPSMFSLSVGSDRVFRWYDREAGPDGSLRQFDPTESPGASSGAAPAPTFEALRCEGGPFGDPFDPLLAPAIDGGVWAVCGTAGIWYGTTGGGIRDAVGPGRVDALALLADGRPVVGFDDGELGGGGGVLVRGEDGGWDRVLDHPARNIFVARDGTVWLSGLGETSPRLWVYRVEGDRWTALRTIDLPAGGERFAEAPDGSVWTGAIAWSYLGGLARCTTTGCQEVLPRPAHIFDVAVASDGRVAVSIAVPTDDQGVFASRIDELVDGSWTTVNEDLYSGDQIAYASDGSLWRQPQGGELQRRDETGTWTTRATAGLLAMFSLSVGPDGAFWWWGLDDQGRGSLQRFDPAE